MHRLTFRASSLLCVASLVTVTIGSAVGNDAHAHTPGVADPTADDLSAQAVDAFGEQRFDEAVDLFNQAYAVDPQPNYLFNIGRVFEEKGDLKSAVEYYQRFVSQPGVDIEARKAATERLQVLKEALAQLEEDEEPQPPVPAPEPQPEPESTDEDPRPDRKQAQRIAGYSMLGVGGVALIVGAVLGGLATGKANDADDAEFVDERLRLRDEARTRARGADAMYITGGVLAGAGLVLVLTTLRKKDRQTANRGRKPAISPMADRRGLGLSIHGRF